MKAINIEWDVDEENNSTVSADEIVSTLPTEIEIPDDIADDEDAIGDYLSDITGYCHKGFSTV
jgi:hypothetical protein